MFELKPHQEEAVKKMHNGCVLCGGVGVGKSHTAVGYYLENEAPKNVYVITTAKKRDKMDWQELFMEVGMYRDEKLTMGATVVVDSWENIKKYLEVKDAFFIFDEQRLVGSGAWVKAFYEIAKHNRWIMLSATPGDNWLDYVPLFRANGFVKNITQFKEDFVVARWTGRYYQVVDYRQKTKLHRWRKQLLVEMPYERHTTRHTHYVDVDYDKDTIRKLVNDRWHVYDERPLTDASELFRVMRRVVYTDDSRLHAVRELLTQHPKLIVFYNFNYELEMLRTLSRFTTPSPILNESSTSESEWPTGLTKTSSQMQSHSPSRTIRMTSDTLNPESSDERSNLTSHFDDAAGQSLRPSKTSDSGTKSSEIAPSISNNTSISETSSATAEQKLNQNSMSPSGATLTEPSFAVAEWNGHKHEPVPDTDSWVYLVQYVAGAEAWECTETDAMVFYSMPYSYKLWWQSHGRIDRLNTSFLDLHYYVLFADSILENGVKRSLAEKKSFNEAAFTDFVGIWQK